MNDKRRVGPVFLYEVNQLKDCESGNCSFAKDLADCIGIGHDLPHVPHITTAGVLDFVSGVKEFSQRTTRKRAKTWMPINSDPKRSMSLHLPHLCPHCSQGFESRQNHFGEDKK